MGKKYIKWDPKMMDVDFAKAVSDAIEEYGNEVADVVYDVADQTAIMARQKLKAESPKKTGKYARSWSKQTKTTRYSKSVIVFQSSQPTLTWLLSSGHAKWLWGKEMPGEYVDGDPHIVDTEEYAEGYFMDEVLRRLS